MSGPFRLPSGGRIDRSRPVAFTFDGQDYDGFAGDTLASALLANGVTVMGRSFKYHRPRGVYSAGPEEPNALVEIGAGPRREPNTRATVAELYEGLTARSQNRWPSLQFDVGSVNDRLARFLPAGFYYKTFMWPPAFWERLYEPAIRRAAGLGTASGEADPDHYAHAHAHCDVLVIGSGAAGLAATRSAGAAGARVFLLEQDFEPGGGLLLSPVHEAWRREMLASLAAMPDIKVITRTTAFGLYDHNVVGAVERVADHVVNVSEHGVRQRLWIIRPRQIVFATGATERLIAFPNNDRPGVMLASAAQTYVRRFAVAPGRRAVVFTNNDLAYDSAMTLAEAGVDVAAIVDARESSLAADHARQNGIAVRLASEVVGVLGKKAVQRVEVRSRSGGSNVIDADLLCVSGGFNPATQLATMSGARQRWDVTLAAFVPGDPERAERSAGAARGIFGIGAAAADGMVAGRAAAAAAGFTSDVDFALPPAGSTIGTAAAPLWEVSVKGKAFVDLQNDVTTDDIRLAHQEGFGHIEHAKRYTTHTMAPDQGKIGGLVGAAVLAAARGEAIDAVGVPSSRPYVSPVTWGAFAGQNTGAHLAPKRLTALHDWHSRSGAQFVEAGQWMRPLCYPRAPDDTGWAPVLREAGAVRSAAGICDVSTLGKIDVQGADAATFLDRLYINSMSTLAAGRVRYGVMLRDDGIVFDDGTVARIAPDRFFVTTSTAKSVEVLEHMEFHAQVVWPELDVQIVGVTDVWTQMSIAGPKARDVLASCVTGLVLDNNRFPHMSVADAMIAGLPVRVFRVSFSGELAYEVAVQAGQGEAVWSAILAAGEPHGLIPYGTDALGSLRIEKGHVAAAEINGHTTAFDLGLHRMMKRSGDCIGRVNAQRPGLIGDERPQLVGIRAIDPAFENRLRAGAHIVDAKGSTMSMGWVSSVTRSVALDNWVGLALVRSGPQLIGNRMFSTFPLKREVVEVEITSPHHVDPENTRVRA